MTRTQYINKVKAKLEEISPFEEPQSLLALASEQSSTAGANTNVKPIISYIEESLDEAAKDCLHNLPLSLLASDIDNERLCVHVSTDGVGRIDDIEDYLRLVRVYCTEWHRDVTAFISSSDPIYLLQQNKYTRGKRNKPVVVYSPELKCLELFSFPQYITSSSSAETHTHGTLFYIDCSKKAERVQSKIEDFIILRCAALVLEILKDNNSSVMMAEYNNKLNDILR